MRHFALTDDQVETIQRALAATIRRDHQDIDTRNARAASGDNPSAQLQHVSRLEAEIDDARLLVDIFAAS